jgi:hypothetical protein
MKIVQILIKSITCKSEVLVHLKIIESPAYALHIYQDQNTDYKNGICCLSAKYATLRR